MIFDEQLLEYPAVLELLGRHAISELGRSRVRALHPGTCTDELTRSVKLVREMMKLIKEGDEPPIHGLRDVTRHLGVARREKAVLDPQELLDVKDFLETAAHTRRYFEELQDSCPGLHALAMPLQAVPALARNIEEKVAPNATVRDSASELLSRLRHEITSTETAIQRDLARMVKDLTDSGDLQDDFYTQRNDRYVLPVKTSNRGKVPGIIHDSSNTDETVFIEPLAILEQTNRLADLRLREKEEIYRILLQVTNHVRDELSALLIDLELLGEMDFVLAKGRFGHSIDGAFPTLTHWDLPPVLVDVHHPLLYAHSPKLSRPLNLGLDQANRALVVSGPNAGGKTTALKTIGLTALMVQSGIPVPLDPRSRFPVFEDVLANIGDEQNILEGQSTFSAHVRRIARILNDSGPGSLVLLDELGTATDPEEGGALAVAILDNLVDRGTLTVVSSHLGVLKNWAHSHENARNASFRLGEKDRKPTYRLALDMVGISEALVVAESAGLPPEVLERARALRPEGEGDATALLLSLKKKDDELAAQLDEANRLRDEAEAKLAALEQQESELREARRTYRNQLRGEKERELGELRAQVERMIAKLPPKEDLLAARENIETIQQQTRQQREQEVEETTPGKHARPLAVGDYVHVRTLREDGVVQQVDNNKKVARVALGKVVVNVRFGDLERKTPPREDTSTQRRGVFYRRPEMASSIIDLHGQRVEEAITNTDKFIDEALASGLNSVRLMHGQGSGALRKGIHEYLRTHPVVNNYRYATSEEGGGGVTVVEFK